MRKKARHNRLLQNLTRNIRERRHAIGITQEQLSEKSGLSANYIGRLEISDRVPSLATLIMLSDALDVEVSELLASDPQGLKGDDAEELVRLMRSLTERDSRFVLGQIRSMVDYIRTMRKDQA